jgi:predicted Rossmann fold nucleotide-binding protein DprA/Smf involved in DNA uptake
MMRRDRLKEQLYALYKASLSLKKGSESLRKFYETCVCEYQQLRQAGIDFLDPDDDRYPAILRERLNFPPLLFYIGEPKLLKIKKGKARPAVAIVGARNASNFGLKCAKLLARELARRGVNVISGYARGIDRMAHLGALQSALKKGGEGRAQQLLS